MVDTSDIPETPEAWFKSAVMKRKRGRPRTTPLPPDPPRPVVVLVCDRRFNPIRALGTGGIHPNTPGDWTAAMILERYGIASHLHVAVVNPEGDQRIIQQGKTTP